MGLAWGEVDPPRRAWRIARTVGPRSLFLRRAQLFVDRERRHQHVIERSGGAFARDLGKGVLPQSRVKLRQQAAVLLRELSDAR